jgi:hypothetical protein
MKIKGRLNSGNAWYYSVQILLSSRFVSKNLNIKTHEVTILPVLYGCKTWSLTLREERGLYVCENRLLRRIFGPNTKEVEGSWNRLHNEEFHKLYASPNIIRVIKYRVI